MTKTTLYVPPGEADSPLPPVKSTGNVLMLSVAGKATKIVFKVKAWDPAKHPKGAKGLFIETPDKISTHEANAGDVIATKSGKVFDVEKVTEKGVKVKPVDIATGEVKTGYTVLGHGIEVAVVDKAKAAGTQHEISTLEPGTYIQHPKSKKRFLVSKHGKWTTVYPVDEEGTVVGKHTVLPPETVVIIENKEAVEVTPAIAKQVTKAAEPIKPPKLTEAEILTDDLLKDQLFSNVALAVAEGDAEHGSDLTGHMHAFPVTDKASFQDFVAEFYEEMYQGETDAESYKEKLEEIEKALTAWDVWVDEVANQNDPTKPIPLKPGEIWGNEDALFTFKFKIHEMVFEPALPPEDANTAMDLLVAGPHSGGFAEMPSEESFVAWAQNMLHVYDVDQDYQPDAKDLAFYFQLALKQTGDEHAKSPQVEEANPKAVAPAIPQPTDNDVLKDEVARVAFYQDALTSAFDKAPDWAMGGMTKEEFLAAATPDDPSNADLNTPEGFAMNMADWGVSEAGDLEAVWRDAMKAAKADLHKQWSDAKEPPLAPYLEQPLGFWLDQTILSDSERTFVKNAVKERAAEIKGADGADSLVIGESLHLTAYQAIESLGYGTGGVPQPSEFVEVIDEWRVAVAHKQAMHAPQSVPSQVQEILPTKLPKVPKKYEPGVGQHTKIVIEKASTGGLVGEAGSGYRWRVRRIDPDNPYAGQTLGIVTTATAARSLARAKSGRHEAIEERWITRTGGEVNKERVKDLEVGQAVIVNNELRIVEHVGVEEIEAWTSGQKEIHTRKYFDLVDPLGDDLVVTTRTTENQLVIPLLSLPQGIQDEIGDIWNAKSDEEGETRVFLQPDMVGRVLEAGGAIDYGDPSTLRGAKPNLFVPELQSDWSYDKIVGHHWADAHKHLTALGWREIKPRQKDMVRYVNANNNRLVVSRNKQGVITDIDDMAASFSLESMGQARDLHATLEEALAQGAEIDDLDPRNSPIDAVRNNIVATTVFDLAKGKQNGIDKLVGGGGKVKSDEAYLAEISAEGIIEDVGAYLEKVDKPPLKIKARGSIIEQFNMKDDPNWDFDNRLLTVPGDMMQEEVAALMAILNRQGAADILHGASSQHDATVAPTFSEKLRNTDPIDGARVLARAIVQYQFDAVPDENSPALIDLDETTRDWIIGAHTEQLAPAKQALDDLEIQHRTRANNLRLQETQEEVDKRRAAEGTVKESTAEFDLPLWDQIALEPQTMDHIISQVGEIKPQGEYGALTDVPAFYNGGYAKDGIVYYRPGQAEIGVELAHDEIVTNVMVEMGASRGPNRHPISPGYSGSSKLYDGESFWLDVEPGTQESLRLTEDGSALVASQREALEQAIKDNGNPTLAYAGVLAVESMLKTDSDEMTVLKYLTDTFGGGAGAKIFAATVTRPGKGIEYVPHEQSAGNAGGAPTSQRGRLTLYGYTPEEAHTQMRKMGFVGDLEDEVPFEVIMGGKRRYGPVAAIHPAYLRGEADLPSTPARITHGITGQDPLNNILEILNNGGLLSIQQRYRAGILDKIPTTSANGDIRSGIDHAVFCTLGIGGACGGGSPIKLVMKPSAFLRRDIVLAPSDFGGSETRYPSYRNYLNKLQTSVGEAKTNLYEPVSPKARQKHLEDVHVGSSNEYNVGPHVAIEDMEYILTDSMQVAEKINDLLNAMLTDGRIASKPQVMIGDNNALGNAKTKGAKIGA